MQVKYAKQITGKVGYPLNGLIVKIQPMLIWKYELFLVYDRYLTTDEVQEYRMRQIEVKDYDTV